MYLGFGGLRVTLTLFLLWQTQELERKERCPGHYGDLRNPDLCFQDLKRK
jgi:hypothetical protein